jgi:hypothetical protein
LLPIGIAIKERITQITAYEISLEAMVPFTCRPNRISSQYPNLSNCGIKKLNFITYIRGNSDRIIKILQMKIGYQGIRF